MLLTHFRRSICVDSHPEKSVSAQCCDVSVRGRHYEFAEDGREAQEISAGWTHGSTPTACGELVRKSLTCFVI